MDMKNKVPRRKFVLLLTDGQPNISPKEGEANAFKKYLLSHPQHNVQVNTFGFGYKLKSDMLVELSDVGGGIFGFIPDAKIVGTNFVNCVSNAITTLCLSAKITLIPLGGSTFDGDVAGDLEVIKKSDILVSFKLKNLQFGQARDFSIPMKLSKDSNYLAVILEYEGYEEGKVHKVHKITIPCSNREKTNDAVAAYLRSTVVSETKSIIQSIASGKGVRGAKSMDEICKLAQGFDAQYENDDPKINGLVCDLIGFGEKGGRMTKSISTLERFNRWGAHYLRSIYSSHKHQLNSNFMDIGLQVYGGETFKQLQDIGGKLFIDLPMVKSLVEPDQNYYNNNNSVNNNQVNNQVNNVVDDNADLYSGGGGGCFEESCEVEVKLGDEFELKQVKDINKDDLVKVYNTNTDEEELAKVICVVKIILNKNEKIVEFSQSNLRITKKHPILFNNNWRFPIDIATNESKIAKIIKSTDGFVVYNFILDKSHVLKVNNTYCVTFGHNISEAYHSFYGTNSVVNTIQKSKDFETGLVTVKENVRNLV